MVAIVKKVKQGPLFKKVKSAPIMRGNLGAHSDQWNIMGSRRKVKKMKQWIDQNMLPGN